MACGIRVNFIDEHNVHVRDKIPFNEHNLTTARRLKTILWKKSQCQRSLCHALPSVYECYKEGNYMGNSLWAKEEEQRKAKTIRQATQGGLILYARSLFCSKLVASRSIWLNYIWKRVKIHLLPILSHFGSGLLLLELDFGTIGISFPGSSGLVAWSSAAGVRGRSCAWAKTDSISGARRLGSSSSRSH